MTRYYSLISKSLLLLATSVMLIAYAGIALELDDWSLLNTVVHEGGELTLLWTILYFEHACRELPPDLLLGMAIGASVYALGGTDNSNTRAIRANLRSAGIIALAAIAAIIGGTVWINGIDAVTHNLLQMHTRPGAELVWGAHWRYHLLSRLSLMLVSLGFAGLLLLLAGRRHANSGAMKGFGISLLLFALVSLAFRLDTDPLFDPIFLGHQIRELFTHALVTLPAAWGMCLLVAQRQEATGGDGSHRSILLSAGLLGCLIGLYVLIAALMKSAASHGQSESFAMLLFPHFFEHSFTYVVVPAVAVVMHEWLRLRSTRRRLT